MNSADYQWNDFDADRVFDSTGVFRYGIAQATAVDPEAVNQYAQWLAEGNNADMDYLARYQDVRSDPHLLLDGATTIISCAIPYFREAHRTPKALKIARYSLGSDYHEIVKHRLEIAATRIRELYGGQTRVCVDTAPIRERYWAEHSGLGFIGSNNQLIIPGAGSYFFLGEILTTAKFRPTEPNPQLAEAKQQCLECRRCLKSCPTGALNANGGCNAGKCLSYITIEHRGEFTNETKLHGSFYGCDRCADVCPHNATPVESTIEEFKPRKRLLELTAEEMMGMSTEEYTATFRGSAMKRAKLAGLQRNAAQIIKEKGMK